MQHSFFNLLRSALIPELRTDIAAGTACNIHFVLVLIAAVGANPNEFAVFFGNLDFTVIAADLAIVALGVELGIHNIVINELDDFQHRRNILLHIRHFDIGNRAARRKGLEFGFQRQFLKRVNRLGHMDMVGVCDIVFIRHALDNAEAFLQALCEFVVDSNGVP